jgi:glucose dehydrogenase
VQSLPANDGVLFLAHPHDVVQALDGRTGDLLWEYRHELPKVEGGYHNDCSVARAARLHCTTTRCS